MANEISANNIKQSYDLAENKIFPKTTINGIVFDSDDSVVGSSAIVKSLVNEDLLVKNIEVNCDSSTGGYIHLKTNNGDESGVGVLELKLGHRGLDTSTANKIYINDAIDLNTDVSAFFNNVEIASKGVNATYDNLQVQCGKFVAKYNDGSIVINNGGVSANAFSIIENGNVRGGLVSWLLGGICLDAYEEGAIIKGFCGASLGKKSSYGEFYADGSVLSLNCMGNSSKKDIIDVSIATRGKLSATYGTGIDFTTKGAFNLNSDNVIIIGDGSVSELNIVQNIKQTQGGDVVKVYSDISNSNQFKFGLGANINSYEFDYYDIVKYTMNSSGIGDLTLATYEYDTDERKLLDDKGYIHISYNNIELKSNDITFDGGHVYGTVNAVHNVLMGVPIGSVVKWLNSSVPEGWCRKSELDNCAYVGFLVQRQRYTDASGIHRSLSTIYKLKGEEYGVVVGNKLELRYCLVYNHDGEKFDDTSHYIMLKSGYVLGLNGCDASNFGKYTFYHVFKGKYEDDGLLYEHSSDKYEFSVSGIYSGRNSRLYFEQHNIQEESLSVVMEGQLPLLVCRDASNNIVKGRALQMGKDIYNGTVTLFSGISDMTIFDNVSKDEIIKYK